MMSEKINTAVIGATGAVGQTTIKILQERKFPVGELYPLASSRSMGKTVEFNSKQCPIVDLETFDFSNCDLALFSAGGSVSKEYVPRALNAGCLVVDNTSFFRNDKDIPLIVAEVNPNDLDMIKSGGKKLVANPNCSTMGLLVAVNSLHDKFGVKRINVSTYQAVSGAGKKAISSLSKQTMSMMRMDEIKEEDYPPFPCQIAFNLIPHIGDFEKNGYTSEEMKMLNETRKILHDKSIEVNATCVRAPVFYGHSMTVNLEFGAKWSLKEAHSILAQTPGLTVKDTAADNGYPTPIGEGGGEDDVFIGRLRADISNPSCLNFWLVSDNLRKGAALNSVQIAELAMARGML